MRNRPIRAFFYQKTMFCGVRLGDWKWIGGATLIVFFLAVFLKWQIRGFNLALPLSVFTCLGGLSLFNWVRMKRKPLWLEHKFAAIWRKIRYRSNTIRPLETGETSRQTNWLIEWNGEKL